MLEVPYALYVQDCGVVLTVSGFAILDLLFSVWSEMV